MCIHPELAKAVDTIRLRMLRTPGGSELKEFLSNERNRRVLGRYLSDASTLSSTEESLSSVRHWLQSQQGRLLSYNGGRIWKTVREILRGAFDEVRGATGERPLISMRDSSSHSVSSIRVKRGTTRKATPRRPLKRISSDALRGLSHSSKRTPALEQRNVLHQKGTSSIEEAQPFTLSLQEAISFVKRKKTEKSNRRASHSRSSSEHLRIQEMERAYGESQSSPSRLKRRDLSRRRAIRENAAQVVEMSKLPDNLEDILGYMLKRFDAFHLEKWVERQSFEHYLRRRLPEQEVEETLYLEPFWEMLRGVQGIDVELVDLYFMQIMQDIEGVALKHLQKRIEVSTGNIPLMSQEFSGCSWDGLDATQLPHLYDETIKKIMDLLFTTRLVMWVSPLSFQEFLEEKLPSCIVRGVLNLNPIRLVLQKNVELPTFELDFFLRSVTELDLPWDFQLA